mgnify:CR=1 FL=1
MQCGDNKEELPKRFWPFLKISHFDFYDKPAVHILEVIARNLGCWQACFVILVIKIDIFQNDFWRGTRRLL